MDLFLLLIGPILIVIIGSWAQTYFFESSKKELDSYNDLSKTTYPKRLFLFFTVGSIITSLLFVVMGVVIYFTSAFEETTQWVAYLVSGTIIMGIPMIGFVNTVTCYELIDDDKITVKRWFKSREVHFKDIKNYKYSFNQLTIYDMEDNPVLFVGDNRVGMNNLISILKSKRKYEN